MENIKICPACKGAKRFLGMGMIKYEECGHCLGVGYIKTTEEEGSDDSNEIMSIHITEKGLQAIEEIKKEQAATAAKVAAVVSQKAKPRGRPKNGK